MPNTEAYPWRGEGTSEQDPFIVETPDDLKSLFDQVTTLKRTFFNLYFKQICNIDLSAFAAASSWIPIGTEEYPFRGQFDGDFFTISNLTVVTGASALNTNYAGLFGCLGKNGVLKNMFISNGLIDNKAIDSVVGGLTGSNNGTITNCASSVTIKSDAHDCYIGGITGVNREGGLIEQSLNTGSIYISGGGGSGGGIAGRCEEGSKIHQCYNSGGLTVNTGGVAGGICGSSATSDIDRCFNIAAVTPTYSDTKFGGVLGVADNTGITINNCFYIGARVNKDNGYGKSKTEEDMVSAAFLNEINASTTLFKNNPVSSCGCSCASSPYLAALEKGSVKTFLSRGILFSGHNSAFILGKGTAAEPFEIGNGDDFLHMEKHSSSHFKLMGDIALYTDASFTGKKALMGTLDGTLDGGGNSISVFFKVENSYLNALIDNLNQNGTIKNTNLVFNKSTLTSGFYYMNSNHGTLENCQLYADVDAAFVRENTGTITNCRQTGSTCNNKSGAICYKNMPGGVISYCSNGRTFIDRYNAGICGYNEGTVTFCYSNANYEEEYTQGVFDQGDNSGICLKNSGTISNCYSTGSFITVYRDSANAGIALENTGTITNCFSDCCATLNRSSGGICVTNSGTISNCYNLGSFGYESAGICSTNNGSISNCYNIGHIPTSTYGGAILCNNNNNLISNCYYINTSGTKAVFNGKPITGGGSKALSQMTDSAFANSLGASSFVVKSYGGINFLPELKVFAESPIEKFRDASKDSADPSKHN